MIRSRFSKWWKIGFGICLLFFLSAFLLFVLVPFGNERPTQIFGLLFFGSFGILTALVFRFRVVVDEWGLENRGLFTTTRHRWFEIRTYRRYVMNSKMGAYDVLELFGPDGRKVDTLTMLFENDDAIESAIVARLSQAPPLEEVPFTGRKPTSVEEAGRPVSTLIKKVGSIALSTILVADAVATFLLPEGSLPETVEWSILAALFILPLSFQIATMRFAFIDYESDETWSATLTSLAFLFCPLVASIEGMSIVRYFQPENLYAALGAVGLAAVALGMFVKMTKPRVMRIWITLMIFCQLYFGLCLTNVFFDPSTPIIRKAKVETMNYVRSRYGDEETIGIRTDDDATFEAVHVPRKMYAKLQIGDALEITTREGSLRLRYVTGIKAVENPEPSSH